MEISLATKTTQPRVIMKITFFLKLLKQKKDLGICFTSNMKFDQLIKQ